MSVSERLLPEIHREFSMTRKILEQIPDENLSWKPHEKSMTLGRLAGHVAEMSNWALVTLTRDGLDINTSEFKALVVTSKADTLAKFDEWFEQAIAALKNTSDDDFAKLWSLTSNGHALLTMPRGAILRSMVLNHMIHHRGQLSVYLRLCNVAVPGMYGPSADESGAAVQASS